jgi:cobalt/nickel transport system permease protein
MKHDFIDKYSDSDSFLHRLDPRGKIIASVAAILAVVSEPAGELLPFAFYYLFILGLVVMSNLPIRFILSRCFQASPFIIAAAVFYPVSFMVEGVNPFGSDALGKLPYDVTMFTLSILFKAFAAVIILTVLISTTGFHRMLWAFRRLRIPKSVCVVSGLMYRYIFLLLDELHKTTRARESRTPGWLRTNRFRVYGNQAAVIFLRGWERAERVYAAMTSRGFTGDFPEGRIGELKAIHIVYSVVLAIPFIIIRFVF